MKLSKLFKKVSVAFIALMIAGMLAACSSPSGGSSGGSGNGAEYTVKYDGIVIGKYDEDMIKSMPEGAGEINGKEVTMTSAYVDEMLAEGKSKKGKDYVAVVFYNGNPITGLTQAEFESAGSLLTENTDYQISSDNKVIVLTDSGAQKMGVEGKKDNSSSKESEEKQPGGNNGGTTTQQNENMFGIISTQNYEGKKSGYYSLWDGTDEDGYIYYFKEADLNKCKSLFNLSASDYNIDETEKKVILTSSGVKKFGDIVNASSQEKKGEGASSSAESEEKKSSEVMKITYVSENGEDNTFISLEDFDSWLASYGLNDNEYEIDASGKNVTLTKSGHDKVVAKRLSM